MGKWPQARAIMDFEAGIDTSAHAVGRAHKRGNFVPFLCARPARACRASLSVQCSPTYKIHDNGL